MVNKMQAALIRKELRGVVKTRSFFLDYLLLPLVFALILPVGAVLLVVLMDTAATEFEQIMAMMMISIPEGGEDLALIQMLINNFMPMFFLMIPPMIVTAISAASFTGEKERRTLETLLYSPMSLREVFSAKIIGALLVAMIVTLVSFVVMVVFVAILVWFLLGVIFIPDLVWVVVLFLVAPAFSFLGIIIQVRISAKAKSSEEAYQRGGVLVLPLILLMVSQFAGFIMISTWMFAVLGVILAVIGWLLMRVAFRKFTYEELLAG